MPSLVPPFLRRTRDSADVAKSANVPAVVEQSNALQGLDYGSPFSPGSPLNPASGYGGLPRAFDYRTGRNIVSRPEREKRVSFDVLRNLIDNYDIARMAIGHRIDDVRSLDWHIIPADGVSGDVDDQIAYAKTLLRRPEGPGSTLPFRAWLAKYLEDVLRYDAGCLYRRRDRAGRVIGLKVVSGPTIAPMLDYWGDTPLPPAPAFVQFAQGQPWKWLTSDDLIYVPFRPQPDSPYGFAPLESVLLTANTDLRFQMHFLRYFTEGTVPEGFATLTPDLSSPDQVREFQEYYDALMMGEDAAKHQIKWVPNGTTFEWPADKTFDENFPLYLMRKVAAAYHVTPNDLGFTEDVNRATGDTQVDVQFRVGTLPLVQHTADIITTYLQDDRGLDVEFQFDTGQEKEDRLQEAQAWAIYIQNGIASPDEAREDLLGKPTDNGRKVARYVFTARGGPIPLSALEAVAGPIDPETGAPAEDAVLPHKPFAPIEGVAPQKPPASPPLAVVAYPADNPSSAQAAAVAAAAPVKKELTSGVTAETGIVGYDLMGSEDEDDEEPDEEAARAELAAFARFTKARRKAGKWRDFTFTAVDEATAAALNAQGREHVAKAGEQPPKAPSWRDGASKTPQHSYDLRLTDHYAPQITAALAAMLPQSVLRAATERAASTVAKDADPSVTGPLRAAARSALGDLVGDSDALDALIRQLVADGYGAGALAATKQLGPGAVTLEGVADLDPADWAPGDPAAAALASNGGLADLLNQAGIAVQGITGSLLDQLGNTIGDGLADGSSVDDIAGSLSGIVADPSRAEMIAHTESARAVTTATMDSYAANGVGQWEWILSDGACPECEDAASDNPYPVGDEGDQPPLHPRCRCSASPVVDSVGASVDLSDAEDDGE